MVISKLEYEGPNPDADGVGIAEAKARAALGRKADVARPVTKRPPSSCFGIWDTQLAVFLTACGDKSRLHAPLTYQAACEIDLARACHLVLVGRTCRALIVTLTQGGPSVPEFPFRRIIGADDCQLLPEALGFASQPTPAGKPRTKLFSHLPTSQRPASIHASLHVRVCP